MRQFNISKGVRGFFRMYEYGVRWSRMHTEEAQKRSEILRFWMKHGEDATKEAFKVSRRTLYNWQKMIREGDGHISALDPKSRAPKTRRKRIWYQSVIEEIQRIRMKYPNLGKEKIHPELEKFCKRKNLQCPSIRTIGRLIADAPDKMRKVQEAVTHFGKPKKQREKSKKERKPKGFEAMYPGHCGSFDTIEEHLYGYRRYVLTFTDLYSRFSFSWATTSHASKAAKEFFELVTIVFPYELKYILTDNGSEFMKEFDQEIRKQHKIHWHTYPRTPKMNAHVERFNRTLQDEFLNFNKTLLLEPDKCNDKMIDYLIWYNGKRPHWSLNLQSPVQFLVSNQHECNMWWPNTSTRQ